MLFCFEATKPENISTFFVWDFSPTCIVCIPISLITIAIFDRPKHPILFPQAKRYVIHLCQKGTNPGLLLILVGINVYVSGNINVYNVSNIHTRSRVINNGVSISNYLFHPHPDIHQKSTQNLETGIPNLSGM